MNGKGENCQKDLQTMRIFLPHSCYLLPKDVLKSISEVSEKFQIPVHIHLHETEREIEEYAQKNNGETAIQTLDKLGLLN